MTMRLLGDRRFVWLLVGQTMSSIAISALWLALGIWAKDLTHSNALAGSVFLALGLPSLLSPFGGHLVDRVRRRPLLIVTNAAIGAIALILLLVHTRHDLWLIYVVAACTGAAMDILSASRTALVKDLLPDDQLGGANALLQTLSQGSRLLSPLLGAGLYTLLGGHGVALVDTALFAVSTIAFVFVRVTESAVEPTDGRRFTSELMAGFRYVATVPVLLQLVVVGALAFCVVGLFETTSFAIIDQGLHRQPSFLGVVEVAQGAGAIIGGVLAARTMRRLAEARTVGLGLLLIGLGAAAMTLPLLVPVMVGVGLIGVGVSLLVVGWGTGLQRFTPPRLQGRVSAAANLVLTGPQTASIALGAALIAVVDYRILLGVIFVGMAASAIVLLVHPAATPVKPPVTVPEPEPAG